MSKDCTTALIVHLIIQYSFTVKYLGAEKFSFSSWSNLQKFLHSDWTELYRLSRPWLVSQTFPKFLLKAKLSMSVFSPKLSTPVFSVPLLPVHVKRMPRANPLQVRPLLKVKHFCSTLTGQAPQEEHIGQKRCHCNRQNQGGAKMVILIWERTNLFYWDSAWGNIVG